MRDYRQALLANMISSYQLVLLVISNIASIQIVSVFLLKAKICKNTGIPNCNLLHFIRYDGDWSANVEIGSLG